MIGIYLTKRPASQIDAISGLRKANIALGNEYMTNPDKIVKQLEALDNQGQTLFCGVDHEPFPPEVTAALQILLDSGFELEHRNENDPIEWQEREDEEPDEDGLADERVPATLAVLMTLCAGNPGRTLEAAKTLAKTTGDDVYVDIEHVINSTFETISLEDLEKLPDIIKEKYRASISPNG